MKVHTINILKTAAVAFAGTLLAASPSFAASIVNGDFETVQFVAPETGTNGFLLIGTGQSIPGPAGWTAIAGNGNGGAAYLGNTIFNNDGAVSRTIGLNGANAQGGISTTISGLISGEILDVSFDLSRNFSPSDLTPPSISVVVGNLAPQIFTLPSVPTFTQPGNGGAIGSLDFTTFVASFLYTGPETATLSFLSQSGASIGPIIDNVAVSQVPFEFSPVTGFIAGGILFGSYKLIKRKKSIA